MEGKILLHSLTHPAHAAPNKPSVWYTLSSDLSSTNSLAYWIASTVPTNLLALWLIEQLFIHNVASALYTVTDIISTSAQQSRVQTLEGESFFFSNHHPFLSATDLR